MIKQVRQNDREEHAEDIEAIKRMALRKIITTTTRRVK